MADETTDSLLDAALDTSKDDDSYALDETVGEDGDAGEDAVWELFPLGLKKITTHLPCVSEILLL